jgi:Domain of unknown function (DUF5134)
MVTVAVYSGGRLVASRPWSRSIRVDVDVVHVLMGAAMAGMFVRALDTLPARVWEVVFSGVAAWFSWRCLVDPTKHNVTRPLSSHSHPASHYPTHGVMALAMLYMYFGLPAQAKVAAGATSMTSGATGATVDFLGLPLVFLILLLGSGVWELDRTGRLQRAALARPGPTVSGKPIPGAAFGGQPRPAPAGWGPEVSVALAADAKDERPRDQNCLAPGLMTASHVAMCIAMSYMLVVML